MLIQVSRVRTLYEKELASDMTIPWLKVPIRDASKLIQDFQKIRFDLDRTNTSVAFQLFSIENEHDPSGRHDDGGNGS